MAEGFSFAKRIHKQPAALSLNPKKQKEFRNKIKLITKENEDENKFDSTKPGVIYISHLPFGFFEETLRQYFSQFGDVKRLRVARSKRTGNCKGYAFLEFASSDVAKVAADCMHNYLMFNKLLKCKVIPEERVHPLLFKGCNRKFKKPKIQRIARRLHNSEKSIEKVERLKKKLRSNLRKKLEKLKALNIDYSLKITEDKIKSPEKLKVKKKTVSKNKRLQVLKQEKKQLKSKKKKLQIQSPDDDNNVAPNEKKPSADFKLKKKAISKSKENVSKNKQSKLLKRKMQLIQTSPKKLKIQSSFDDNNNVAPNKKKQSADLKLKENVGKIKQSKLLRRKMMLNQTSHKKLKIQSPFDDNNNVAPNKKKPSADLKLKENVGKIKQSKLLRRKMMLNQTSHKKLKIQSLDDDDDNVAPNKKKPSADLKLEKKVISKNKENVSKNKQSKLLRRKMLLNQTSHKSENIAEKMEIQSSEGAENNTMSNFNLHFKVKKANKKSINKCKKELDQTEKSKILKGKRSLIQTSEFAHELKRLKEEPDIAFKKVNINGNQTAYKAKNAFIMEDSKKKKKRNIKAKRNVGKGLAVVTKNKSSRHISPAKMEQIS